MAASQKFHDHSKKGAKAEISLGPSLFWKLPLFYSSDLEQLLTRSKETEVVSFFDILETSLGWSAKKSSTSTDLVFALLRRREIKISRTSVKSLGDWFYKSLLTELTISLVICCSIDLQLLLEESDVLAEVLAVASSRSLLAVSALICSTDARSSLYSSSSAARFYL